MFRYIFDRRKTRGLLLQALEETRKMLKREEKMFSTAVESLMYNREADIDLHRYDVEINRGEKIVRRMMLEHLTVNPKQDLPACLVLISIVIDVERIGDYTKSIFELGRLYEQELSTDKYVEECDKMRQLIHPMFQQTIDAFIESRLDEAKEVMEMHKKIKANCDQLIKDVVTKGSIPRGKCVVLTLLARYFRRVSAHLSNIASSVVNPFDEIGFDDEL
ncbi:MAG: PhoU domain-containing protein [Acidobacteriota bacterium]